MIQLPGKSLAGGLVVERDPAGRQSGRAYELAAALGTFAGASESMGMASERARDEATALRTRLGAHSFDFEAR